MNRTLHPLRERKLVTFLFALLLIPSVGIADSELPGEETTPQEPAKQTSNYGKTGRFLPGEEVVGPTGKKVKVWSTEGPVSVSQAPEPFEDTAEKRLPPDAHIVIDDDDLRRRRGEGEHGEGQGDRRRRETSRDTFEIPGSERR